MKELLTAEYHDGGILAYDNKNEFGNSPFCDALKQRSRENPFRL